VRAVRVMWEKVVTFGFVKGWADVREINAAPQAPYLAVSGSILPTGFNPHAPWIKETVCALLIKLCNQLVAQERFPMWQLAVKRITAQRCCDDPILIFSVVIVSGFCHQRRT